MKKAIIVLALFLLGLTTYAQKRGYHNIGHMRGTGMLVGIQKDGTWVYTYPNGDTARVINYKKDMKNGPYSSWSEGLRLLTEGVYLNDTIVGALKHWATDTTFTTGNMIYPDTDQEWIYQHVSGEVYSTWYVRNGKRHGKSTSFLKGELNMTQYYDYGVPSGTWVNFICGERKVRVERSFNNGKLVLLIQRNSLGTLLLERKFSNGKITSEKCWDNEGESKDCLRMDDSPMMMY